jgi:MFS family permease
VSQVPLSGNFLVRAIRANPQGWIVILVLFLVLSVVSATRASIGLVMPSLEQDLGWSKSFISSAAAWALVMMAITSPFVGNLLDRVGVRAIMMGGLGITAVSLIVTSQVDETWQFVLSYAVLAGIGFGTASKNIASATVARYFHENRGLAVGFATAGSTAGHLALLPAMAVILTVFGWRWGYLFLGIVCLALLPMVWTLLGKPAPHRKETPSEAKVPEALGPRLKMLFTNRTYLALLGSYTICGFTATGVTETHLLPYAVACGIPIVVGASAFGLLAACNMGGMAISGYLTDRIHRPRLLAIIYTMRGMSFIILMMIPVYNLDLIWVFAVVFGMFDYSTIPVTTSLVASHVGLKIIGLSLGILAMFHSGGAALGTFLGGVLFDLFQKYDWVWISAIGLALIASVLALTIPETPDHSSARPKPVPPVPVPAVAD